MRTFALMIVFSVLAAFTAVADENCDCDKKESVNIEKVEVEKVEVTCPESEKPQAPRRQRDHFRIGIVGTSELAEQSEWWNYFQAAFENTNLFPGLYWELKLGHLGIGMTYLGRFTFADASLPWSQRTWLFDVIGTIDLRFHLLAESFFDPFAEVGIGAAGRASMAPIAEDAAFDMLAASIFAQAGIGLGVNFNRFHLGAKFMYRFFQDAIPCVDLPAYDVSKFELSLFAGFSLF